MKKKYYYQGKTGIAHTKGFEDKLLAKYAVNIGNMCDFGCTFCYVPAVTIKQKYIQSVLKDGDCLGDFSSYRDRQNVLQTVRKDLKKFKNDDNSEVFFCTTCDPCSTQEHTETSIEAIRAIFLGSNLQVRILSKSSLIKQVAEELKDYKNRIVFSLSTGTSLPEISASIEHFASPIEERVRALHWLQDYGFRTYGMICPVLPSEIGNASQLLSQVRPQFCEHVWVEALNVRGKSLVNTYDTLMASGLNEHALELQRVMGNKENWVEYSKKLFLSFQKQLSDMGQLQKLRFLQYVSKRDREFFENQPGAICL
jgi:DNA repair photolyase